MIDLKHGDCLELMKNIPDGSIDLVLTDPPYGTTACKWDSIIPFEPMWEQLNRIIKPNGAICLFGSEPFSSALRMSNIKNFRYDWIWFKNLRTGFANAKYQPMKSHEIISVFYKKIPTYNPQKKKRTTKKGGNKKTAWGDCYGGLSNDNKPNNQGEYVNPHTVIDFIKCIHTPEKRFHSTQKPVALLEYLVKTYTNEGATVLDFTMGSGSTGVACVNTKRKFIGIELDEGYFNIAKERIESAVDQIAKEILEGSE
jgi:site-specific DNA-methyltransferase (adenine-specific)